MSTTIELGRVACVARGAYDPAAEYEALDIITHAGCSYLVTADCNGQAPPNGEYYMLLASIGPQGLQGMQGEKGDKGDKGDTGTGLQVKGTFAMVAALEAAVTDPAVGDMYNVGASAPFNIYMWNGAAWEDQGQLQGEQGIPGAIGPAGPNEISTTTATAINGLIKGNGANAAQAIPGTDYAVPTTDLTAALTTSWTGSSAPYTQTVNVAGITAAMKPIVDIVLSSAQATAETELKDWSKVSKIETGAGTITATCFTAVPTVALNLTIKVVG